MRHSYAFTLFMLFAMSNVLWGQAGARLFLIDGTLQEHAVLGTLSDKWNFGFQIEGRTETVVLDQFVKWGNRVPMPEGPSVQLVDGSQIMLDSSRELTSLRSGLLRLESRIWDPVKIPLAQIRTVSFSQVQRRAESNPSRSERHVVELDEVTLVSGRRQQGRFAEIDADQITMKVGSQTVAIQRNQVRSLSFANAEVKRHGTDETCALIGLRDGSVLCSNLSSLNEKRLTVQLECGVVLKTRDASTASELVRSVRLFHRSIRYLSDMQPFAYKHVPYLSRTWSFGQDENLFGDPLRHQRTPFSKGISMHSLSRLAFRLPEGFDRFESELAFDDSAGQGGSVVFRVFLEQQGQWKEAFQSGEMVFGAPSIRCNVELGQATGIALVVDGAGDTDYMDHANWLDARILMNNASN